MTLKKLIGINRNVETHWVGNGFPVKTVFSVHSQPDHISPFLMLDYAGPALFEPSPEPRGVGEHPHRGFETVTIVYQGRLEHRDSAGNHGKIGPGDVQWMTAASGVVHEEWHDSEFTRTGGMFEVAQLWVNLPAKEKMSPPRYQEILNGQIPVVEVKEGVTARVIAGDFLGAHGPARTFTPIALVDLKMNAGSSLETDLPDGHTTLLLVLKGKVELNQLETAGPADLAVFDRAGERITIDADEDSTLLLLSGEPINEPVASYGPFVMNTQAEIQQAINDFRNGRMGRLAT